MQFPGYTQCPVCHELNRGLCQKPECQSIEPVIQPDQLDKEPPDAFEGLEKLLHRDFLTDMQRRGVHCIHARDDTNSTIERGLPDVHCMFTGPDGVTRGIGIEFKRKGGSLSKRQTEKIAEMRALKIPVKVCWSLRDAILFAREKLGC